METVIPLNKNYDNARIYSPTKLFNMKTVLKSLKALCFFFSLFIVNSIYSQGACGAGYSITSTYNSDCDYTFTPVVPGGTSVDHYHWSIGSSGTYKSACDTFATSTSTPSLRYLFCFSGNHDIVLTVIKTNGTRCAVTLTVNVTCSSGPVCDPDPARTSPIPDPLVEITYIGIDYGCGSKTAPDWNGCMWEYNSGSGLYDYACGWIWNIRIVPSTSNCEYFTYHVSYIDTRICDSTCRYSLLTPGVDSCIYARMNVGIVIWADGNNCCVPVGYQTGYIWNPYPNTVGFSDPVPTISTTCQNNRCPTTMSCTESQQTMNNTSLPATHCPSFSGGTKFEQRISNNLNQNANIEQNVAIYNLQGKLVFDGKWKFGDPSNLSLQWPNGVVSGLYFVLFEKTKGEGLIKLYKWN